MPSDAFTESYNAVQKLSQKEWKELKAKMLFDQQYSRNQELINQSKNDWLLQAVLAEVRTRGTERIPRFFYVKSDSHYYGYVERSEFIRNYLNKHFPNPTKREQIALGHMAIASLCKYLERYTSVNLNSLLCNIDKIPDAIEKSFPTYIKNGNLSLTLKTVR